jgi:hypothetical protein
MSYIGVGSRLPLIPTNSRNVTYQKARCKHRLTIKKVLIMLILTPELAIAIGTPPQKHRAAAGKGWLAIIGINWPILENIYTSYSYSRQARDASNQAPLPKNQNFNRRCCKQNRSYTIAIN